MTGRERDLSYVKDEVSELESAHLTGTKNICPVCGLAFKAVPPLRPIKQKDKEVFYGGRVSFFKEVECKCKAKYDLCIEKKFNGATESDIYNVIDMVILKPGKPIEPELEKEEVEALAAQAMHDAIENSDRMPTIHERNEIKKQTILATVVDREAKMQTLLAMTTKELQTMCKRRKLSFAKKDNKTKLAEILLAYDPSVVVANPED